MSSTKKKEFKLYINLLKKREKNRPEVRLVDREKQIKEIKERHFEFRKKCENGEIIDRRHAKKYLYNKRRRENRKLKRKWRKSVLYLEKPLPYETWDEYSKRVHSNIVDPENAHMFDYVSPWKTYMDYCKSPEFHSWKKRVLKRDKNKCQMCGGKAVVAHHINYRRWGTELLSDGLSLCGPCHKEVPNIA